MCGRFELNISKDKLIQKFGVDTWQLDNYKPRYNIPPTTNIPIIRNKDNSRTIEYAHWGLIPSWAKDRKIGYKTFNARSETLAEKPSFRTAYKKRRCLIPASGYYEWKKLDVKNKQPYWIGRKDKEPFLMAGLYEDWTDTETGKLVESCTIITRDAYPKLRDIHSRMPVILPNEFMQYWLAGNQNDFPTTEIDHLDFYPISKEVGSPKNDYLFKPIDTV